MHLKSSSIGLETKNSISYGTNITFPLIKTITNKGQLLYQNSDDDFSSSIY